MITNTERMVLRGETKYLEKRVERVRASGFVDDVLTLLVEVKEKTITKKQIRIYDISTTERMDITERLFHYGESCRDLRWKRNSKIAFDGTLYTLRKCKGKNDQKPGPKEIWEIRNPRNVEVIEFETTNKYRPTKKKRRKSRRKREEAKLRQARIKVLEQEQREDDNR